MHDQSRRLPRDKVTPDQSTGTEAGRMMFRNVAARDDFQMEIDKAVGAIDDRARRPAVHRDR
ncbi:hypothetical protein [Brevundimonas sp. DC300-4]|uniref:hypothetical protein n=1 Tax=unclassified Brevundimonas TaxID=2622653 RepID=UPI003CF5836C